MSEKDYPIERIYCKNIKARSKKEFILKLLPNENRGFFPETYYSDTNRLQCYRKAARSFRELFWLFKTRFKTATRKELAKILLDKRHSNIRMYYCDDVEMLMVTTNHGYSAIPSFINAEGHEYSMHLDEYFHEYGETFEDVLQLALQNKDFTYDDINLNPDVF
jgi:hypothetical protein